MAVSDSDTKILWGRAAGFCSNPGCNADLTMLLRGGLSFHVGEMAHVIAHRSGGPRGRPGGGSDRYDNLILLCPTCHTKIDKAPPGLFPEDLLQDWKAKHEERIRFACADVRLADLHTLKHFVTRLLDENWVLWTTFGPQSSTALADPGSNLYIVWQLRKLDKIIPNNIKIMNSVRRNIDFLDRGHLAAFYLFEAHALAFEQHQYDRLDNYPLFPAAFAEAFRP